MFITNRPMGFIAFIFILPNFILPKSWEQVKGPAGGAASSIIRCNGSLFAGSCGGGIFRSDDNGSSWRHLDRSYTMDVTSLASKASILIVGSRGNGIFRSSDLGITWTNVYKDAISPESHVNAIKVIDSFIFAGTNASILRSSDTGKTWSSISNNPGFPKFYFCSDFAKIGNYYFASSSQSYGIIRSEDNGNSWIPINAGLSDTRVYSLAVIDTILFAGTYKNSVLSSADYGNSWVQCGKGLPENCYVQFVYVDNSSLIASVSPKGLYISKDHGNSWNAIAWDKPYNPHISCMLEIATGVYIGTGFGAGIYKINCNENAISTMNKGFFSRNILSLSSNDTTLLASSFYYNSSIFQNSGNDWTNEFEEQVSSYGCLVDGSDLYVGTNGLGIFYKKINSPYGWKKQTAELDSNEHLDIRGFETIGNYVLACGSHEKVYRKVRGDSVWKKHNTEIAPGQYFAAILENRGRLFLSGYDFFISDDSGTTWTIKLQKDIRRFTAIASEGNMVFTGRYAKGVCWSLDNGTTWNEPASILLDINALAVWKGTVFAGTKYRGMFISRDTAKTWKAFNDSLYNMEITSLTIHRSILYAGTFGSGIFKFDLNSLFTQPVSYNGFPAKNPKHFTIVYSGHRVYIDSREPIRTIELYDLLGRNVRELFLTDASDGDMNRFSFETARSGALLAKISIKNGQYSSSVIMVK